MRRVKEGPVLSLEDCDMGVVYQKARKKATEHGLLDPSEDWMNPYGRIRGEMIDLGILLDGVPQWHDLAKASRVAFIITTT